MIGRSPPLRFLALVIGGWVCARAAMLFPVGAEPQASATAAGTLPVAVAGRSESPTLLRGTSNAQRTRVLALAEFAEASSLTPIRFSARQPIAPPVAVGPGLVTAYLPAVMAQSSGGAPLDAAIPSSATPPPISALVTRSGRWSLSSWAYFREGSERQLAAGGTLGGSQVGARLGFRLQDRLSVSGRVYAPLAGDGLEASLGLEWQPARGIPVRLLAERRQAIGDEGRSAFALAAHGGVSEHKLIGPLRLDAYAQAGVVGLKSRDAFADGAVRVHLPLGPQVAIGAGLWGAAQPGAARLDVGPSLSLRLPSTLGAARLLGEWRIRAAGDAAPGSGPALTLAADF